MLRNDDPKENDETAKHNFEKFFSGLSASSKRIEAVDAFAFVC